MNKLKDYKRKISDPFSFGDAQLIERGFDAAIALDLPMKFHSWAISTEGNMKLMSLIKEIGFFKKAEEAWYKYWVENILKLE